MWNWFRLAFLRNQLCTAEQFRNYVALDARLRRLFRIPMPSRLTHDGYYRALEDSDKTIIN